MLSLQSMVHRPRCDRLAIVSCQEMTTTSTCSICSLQPNKSNHSNERKPRSPRSNSTVSTTRSTRAKPPSQRVRSWLPKNHHLLLLHNNSNTMSERVGCVLYIDIVPTLKLTNLFLMHGRYLGE